MSNLKRYEFAYDQGVNCGCQFFENSDGEWVKFEDIKHLLPTGAQQLKAEILPDFCEGMKYMNERDFIAAHKFFLNVAAKLSAV